MKKTLILLAVIFASVNITTAQLAKNDAIYAASELNLGKYYGMDLNLNYVLNEKYSFKLGYTGYLRKPKTLPEDFSTGVIGILVWGLNHPMDKFENYGASVGRIYKINLCGTIRVNLSLGVGYSILTEPDNWEKINNNAISLQENYSYDNIKHKAVSLIVNPKIEFPITRFFGFTISPMLQINKERTYFGIGIGSMIGILK